MAYNASFLHRGFSQLWLLTSLWKCWTFAPWMYHVQDRINCVMASFCCAWQPTVFYIEDFRYIAGSTLTPVCLHCHSQRFCLQQKTWYCMPRIPRLLTQRYKVGSNIFRVPTSSCIYLISINREYCRKGIGVVVCTEKKGNDGNPVHLIRRWLPPEARRVSQQLRCFKNYWCVWSLGEKGKRSPLVTRAESYGG